MAVYTPDKEFDDGFASLFLADSVPYHLDVQYIIAPKLDYQIHASYVLQTVTNFCLEMMNLQEDLESLAKQSFCSEYFKISGDFAVAKSERFFECLCNEAIEIGVTKFDALISYFKEEAKYIVIFHNVKVSRVIQVMNVFVGLFNFLTTHEPLAISKFDVRKCDCETFKRSGDCNCQISDLHIEIHDDGDDVFS